MQYRSVEDHKGLQYVFLVSASVDESALLTAQRGILVAFRKGKGQSWEVLDGKGTMRFKNLNTKKPIKINTDQATWDDLITSKLSVYSDRGFKNSPKVKIAKIPAIEVDLLKVKETSSGDLYVDKTVKCGNKACNTQIVGKQFYRHRKDSEGLTITHYGRFIPNDEGAQRVRPKSKSWFCAKCAVTVSKGGQYKSDSPEVFDSSPVLDQAVVKEIEEMLSPTSTVNAEFARGANWALRKLVVHQTAELPD